jgi:hypothetical protein
VVLDNYFLTMSEPARDMSLPRDAITYAVDDPERAIRIAALYGVRILSPLEAEKELPQYPGFGVAVRSSSVHQSDRQSAIHEEH